MKVEVIAIGSEILSGFTINTNAAFISQELLKVGIETSYHTIVSDDRESLLKAFTKALKRSDMIISTGGLGPTCDDVTRSVSAELFGSEFVYYPKIEEELDERFGHKLTSARDQATLPEKAELIKNSLGTASGLLFKRGNKALYLLPGVSTEMREMFTHSVLSKIELGIPENQKRKSEWLHFSFLFESKVDPVLRELQEYYPSVQMGIYPSLGKISVCLSTLCDKRIELENCKSALVEKFAKYLYESPSGTIEEAVHLLFTNKQLTLATAESCTGGAIASRLTALAGASHYFLGGVIAYSNGMKRDLLGVSEQTLSDVGAVSEEVVIQMAEGVVNKTGAGYGIAVSGVAGPLGGTKDKPVGSVWAAIAGQQIETVSWLIQSGNVSREMIIDYTTNTVLGRLYHLCKEKFPNL